MNQTPTHPPDHHSNPKIHLPLQNQARELLPRKPRGPDLLHLHGVPPHGDRPARDHEHQEKQIPVHPQLKYHVTERGHFRADLLPHAGVLDAGAGIILLHQSAADEQEAGEEVLLGENREGGDGLPDQPREVREAGGGRRESRENELRPAR